MSINYISRVSRGHQSCFKRTSIVLGIEEKMSGAAGPFENNYYVRRVNSADAKSCFICYKPSPCVLITQDSADFFYICESHLKDTTFATPVLNDDYHSALKKQKFMKEQIENLKEKIRKETSMWSTLFDKIAWSSDKKEANSDGKEGDALDLKAKEQQEKAQKNLNEDQIKLDLLKKELQNAETIINKPFKNFTLHKDMFRIRLNQFNQKKRNKIVAEKLTKPGFFPSVGSLPNLNLNKNT